MKIYEFPGSAHLNKKVSKKIPVKLDSSPNEKILLGDISFTCPYCKTVSTFSSENLIFRSLDFYCSKCGSRHKISNPAFSYGAILEGKKKAK